MSRYKLYTSEEHNRSMLHDTKHGVIAGLAKTDVTDDEIEILKKHSADLWYAREKYYKEELGCAVLVAEWD